VGTGALEREQQELLEAAATFVMPSSMFIWSHCDCVCGVAHSAILDEKIAQADRGTGPNPAMLNANAKISSRRIAPQLNGAPPISCAEVSVLFGEQAVTLVTILCDFAMTRLAVSSRRFQR
jgi:hypothetical protein